MAPFALAPRPRNLSISIHNDLHALTKREQLSKRNIITLAVFLVILLFILLFFGIFVPRYTRQKKLKERQHTLREMLTAEERAASRAGPGRMGGGSGTDTLGADQRQGGEAIPLDDMAVPNGDGGWVEPPPPYVADPKPTYHP
ncbi:hypothetical protein QBC32DRAFT_138205 [Pseudoneurospora amorphoporcata]|uniref:Uncharacterized protein n=1 Tax=Pseudoneurospora amorphoporcata TaxID=241081 RepID=A0AAN6SK86_9PEZI|nr:hypothetical protein QBC32DRAFT_138205 [Pseudoneurospora amorphoporcata]